LACEDSWLRHAGRPILPCWLPASGVHEYQQFGSISSRKFHVWGAGRTATSPEGDIGKRLI
jgi:hypothetical protein